MYVEATIELEGHEDIECEKGLLQVSIGKNGGIVFGVIGIHGDLVDYNYFEELNRENAIKLRDLLNYLLPSHKL